MPSFEDLKTEAPLRILNMGRHGTAKTGALLSLLEAGFNVRIINFEASNISVFQGLANPKQPSDPKAPRLKVPSKEALGRLRFETFDDMTQLVAGKIMPKQADAYSSARALLDNWVDSKTGEVFGPIREWTLDDVLVIDTLGSLSEAAERHYKKINPGIERGELIVGKTGEFVKDIIYKITREAAGHVIVNAHIKTFDDSSGSPMESYPDSIGRALPSWVPKQFPIILYSKIKRIGAEDKRFILTKPDGLVHTKFPVLGAQDEFPCETGLAEIFRLLGYAGPIQGS